MPCLSRYFLIPHLCSNDTKWLEPGHFDKWRSEGNKTNFKLCNWWLVWGHSDKIKRYFLLWPGHKHQWAQCPVVMPGPPLFVRPMKKLVQIIHKQKESLTCGNGTATIFMTMSFVSQMICMRIKRCWKPPPRWYLMRLLFEFLLSPFLPLTVMTWPEPSTAWFQGLWTRGATEVW